MKEEILLQIRSFVFPDVASKVSRMLDQYKQTIESSCSAGPTENERSNLFKDQIEHLLHALEMISKVPENAEGATMARGIADEAMSAVSTGR